MTTTILGEAIAQCRALLGDDFGGVTVERAVIGLFFTGVKLSNGIGGCCYTPIKSLPEAVCCPSSAAAMPMPGRIRGRPVADFLRDVAAPQGVRRALAIAVLNAVADTCWRRQPQPHCRLETGADAFEAAIIPERAQVVMVGAIGPYLKALRRSGQPFLVLEKDPSTLRAEEMAHYRPAAEAASVVPQAGVLIITGATMVTDTLDEILALARPGAEVVVVGPTAGLTPEPLFRRGVRVVGGIRVNEPDAFLDVLSEGGSGLHFFGKSAERITLIRESAPAGLAR